MPILKPVKEPGPLLTAIASSWLKGTLAFVRISLIKIKLRTYTDSASYEITNVELIED